MSATQLDLFGWAAPARLGPWVVAESCDEVRWRTGRWCLVVTWQPLPDCLPPEEIHRCRDGCTRAAGFKPVIVSADFARGGGGEHGGGCGGACCCPAAVHALLDQTWRMLEGCPGPARPAGWDRLPVGPRGATYTNAAGRTFGPDEHGRLAPRKATR